MMTRQSIRTALIGALVICFAPTANPQGFIWLDRSPVESFTEQDWALLRSAVRQALDDGDQGETFGWHNETSGASGTITVLEDSEHEGMKCRRAKFFNSAGGFTGTGHHRLCKTADGTWRIAPP